MGQSTHLKLQLNNKNPEMGFIMGTSVNDKSDKNIELKAVNPAVEQRELLLHNTDLKELLMLRARFESMASYQYHYPYHRWRPNPAPAKIFFGRLKTEYVPGSLARMVKSLLF